ncbi:unnamed protein product [Cyclocybe aegerita]|uniref:Uncharacterized protein n=1 Tax=Cyclocybe aegerita TaxID=1973307 RepID=A0A8S0VRH8_CYCAE|nr:unnamed protein product [Cyclocybe aegerita]
MSDSVTCPTMNTLNSHSLPQASLPTVAATAAVTLYKNADTYRFSGGSLDVNILDKNGGSFSLGECSRDGEIENTHISITIGFAQALAVPHSPNKAQSVDFGESAQRALKKKAPVTTELDELD